MSTNKHYNHIREIDERLTDFHLSLVKQVCHFLEKPDMVEAAQEHFIYKDLVKKCLKPKKDVNAPKKPLTSYMLFCQSIREEVTAKHPTLKMQELSKKLSERWASANEDVKADFAKQAEQEKEAYSKKFEEYTKKLTQQDGSLTGIGSTNSMA